MLTLDSFFFIQGNTSIKANFKLYICLACLSVTYSYSLLSDKWFRIIFFVCSDRIWNKFIGSAVAYKFNGKNSPKFTWGCVNLLKDLPKSFNLIEKCTLILGLMYKDKRKREIDCREMTERNRVPGEFRHRLNLAEHTSTISQTQCVPC